MNLFIPGTPAPKGSTKAYVVKGRAVTTNANAKTKPWQQQVSVMVAAEVGSKILFPRPAPVILVMEFVMPRTTSEPKRTTRAHTRKPDSDKLARSVFDALTGVVYEDDSQVVDHYVRKRTALIGEQPGLHISWETQ